MTTNTAITNTTLNVANDTARQTLFTSVRTGRFGDIIHSEPAVIFYPAADKSIIYVGANDGMLHAIDDGTGLELWAFVPPEHLERLWRLEDADHDYFVDGSPVVYNGTSQKILLIGSRRGGHSYTALDITDSAAPRYLYTIGPTALGTGSGLRAILGPAGKGEHCHRLHHHNDRLQRDRHATKTDVFLFAGGYDTNQDVATPTATDQTGRAVFAVNVATGAVVSGLKFTPATHSSARHDALDSRCVGIRPRQRRGRQPHLLRGTSAATFSHSKTTSSRPSPPARPPSRAAWCRQRLDRTQAVHRFQRVGPAQDFLCTRRRPGVLR